MILIDVLAGRVKRRPSVHARDADPVGDIAVDRFNSGKDRIQFDQVEPVPQVLRWKKPVRRSFQEGPGRVLD